MESEADAEIPIKGGATNREAESVVKTPERDNMDAISIVV
jgi:hypothetical protein